MNSLNISIIQTHLTWENAQLNIAHFDAKINSINMPVDIIVLPEMFTTGFTMKPSQLAEEHGGEGLQWMQKKAIEKKCVIVGSISVSENHKFYNRLYWVTPNGEYQSYDKRHLFRMGNEHEHYSGGDKKIIVEYKGWKICPLICYDLRFPVWSRNTKSTQYDLLIYVANWPAVRAYPWKQLLIARAIENQAYVVASNIIGNDGNSISHSGNSVILSPKGEAITPDNDNEDIIITHQINLEVVHEFRKQFPALLDADDFEITL